MRRKVLLSSLTVGRCFTLAVEPGGNAEDAPGGSMHASPVLKPEDAWKVVGEDGGAFQAESASGSAQSFPADSEVVEIPRQGYDKLASRA